MSELNITRPAEESARKLGCYVVYPEDDQLQIDLDDEKGYALFQKRIRDAQNFLDWEVVWEEQPSKSGLPHRHITVTVRGKNFTPEERILYQVMFGSDPIREGLSVLRLKMGIDRPTRFFEPLPPLYQALL